MLTNDSTMRAIIWLEGDIYKSLDSALVQCKNPDDSRGVDKLQKISE